MNRARRHSAISVIVFDLDDTLYLERDFVSSGFAAVAAWLRDRQGVEGFAARAEKVFAAGERRHVFNVVLRQLGLPATLVADMVDVYRDHVPTIALAADAARFLARDGRRRALVSDGYLRTQANKVAALGLEDAGFAPIVLTDRWGRACWKPHRRGFDHVAAHFGVTGAEMVYVADNPAKDFVAPRALGWHSVQIVRQAGIHPADVRGAVLADLAILSLDDLDDALLELQERPILARAAH
ncbi:HAD family hydrolase [Sandarakinorhabdus sp. DWP1-3-1]|uniref:HAD family hydrolase n=1 Tax=Sandarakinorhabdus sp. DWP1-3-1 TaxID=2804627 RepID=UPI003CF67E45